MTTHDSWRTVWVAVCGLLLGVLAVAGVLLWDQPVLEAVRGGAGKDFRSAARLLSRYGDFPWLLGAGMAALAFCLATQRRQGARLVAAMILAGVLAGLAANGVKLTAGRVRPRVEKVAPGWYGPRHEGRWVVLEHDYQSFPSSHAACAFGFFFPLFFSRRRVGLAGLAVATLISWSRIQLNAHHISDIAVGTLLGLLAGWLVWRWIVERDGLSRWLDR